MLFLQGHIKLYFCSIKGEKYYLENWIWPLHFYISSHNCRSFEAPSISRVAPLAAVFVLSRFRRRTKTLYLWTSGQRCRIYIVPSQSWLKVQLRSMSKQHPFFSTPVNPRKTGQPPRSKTGHIKPYNCSPTGDFFPTQGWEGVWYVVGGTSSCQRPYCVENTGSHPNSEVKRRKARIVLGWVTAREVLRVLLAFYLFRPAGAQDLKPWGTRPKTTGAQDLKPRGRKT
jgi:hypothetical protein